jgi:hypothetical protein
MISRRLLPWCGILAFSRVLTHSREKELLFGTQSLLARYGPLIVEICGKPEIYRVIRSLLCFRSNDIGYQSADGGDPCDGKIYVCFL